MKPTRTTPEREAFLDACMESDIMRANWESDPQRTMVCDCQHRRAVEAKGEKATWAEHEAGIKAKGVVFTAKEARIIYSGIPVEEIESGKRSPFGWNPSAINWNDGNRNSTPLAL